MEKNLDSMSESLDQDNNDSLLSIDTSDSLLMIRPIRECFVGSERNAPDTSPKIFASDPFEKSEYSRVHTSAVDSRIRSFEASKSSTLFSELDATENDTASLAALDDEKISPDISSNAEAILLQTTEESEVSMNNSNNNIKMVVSRPVSNEVMDNHQVQGNSTILESSSNSHVELVSSMDQSDDELSADISPTTEAKLLRTTEKSELSDNSNSDVEMCDSRLVSNLAPEVNNNNGPLANSTFLMTNSNSNVEFDSRINQVGDELSADITPITEAKLLQTTEESQ
ncbi:hypothetical protein QAD02_006062 [Eretmocerus hayati]|uniref:Uncharacterized protein n=1 Tax=Eretmocerus hayati TaxID=131215 RepID=A0ACC2MZY9_9HYME|nr:hypothetical protein QAD02_006062 [Eretmocerus hayati]